MKILFFEIETRARAGIADPAGRKAAADPDTGEIDLLALQFHPGREDAAVLTRRAFSEDAILNTFWASVSSARGNLAGYDILAFDIPFILRRSLALKVPSTWPIRPGRTYGGVTCDLGSLLYGGRPPRPLAAVAELCSLEDPGPAALSQEMRAARRLRLCISLYERMAGLYFDRPAWMPDDDFPF